MRNFWLRAVFGLAFGVILVLIAHHWNITFWQAWILALAGAVFSAFDRAFRETEAAS